MAYRFNPPPNWPIDDPQWSPPPGWQPDPSWGPAPEGWNFWVSAEDAPAAPSAAPEQAPAEQPAPAQEPAPVEDDATRLSAGDDAQTHVAQQPQQPVTTASEPAADAQDPSAGQDVPAVQDAAGQDAPASQGTTGQYGAINPYGAAPSGADAAQDAPAGAHI